MTRAGKKLSAEDGRKALYSAETQDAAYRGGAYDYLETIDLAPRMAIIATYVHRFGAKSVLDVGCGFADLLAYLDAAVGYIGIDISPTAIAWARERFAGRAGAAFHVGDFREANAGDWQAPAGGVDAVLWAGIGRTWTRKGRKGDFADWLEIVELAERPLKPGGIVIFEMVTPHWAELEPLIAGRYDYAVGCDLDCLNFDATGRRSARVFRRRDG